MSDEGWKASDKLIAFLKGPEIQGPAECGNEELLAQDWQIFSFFKGKLKSGILCETT